jgi:hypothetical protein
MGWTQGDDGGRHGASLRPRRALLHCDQRRGRPDRERVGGARDRRRVEGHVRMLRPGHRQIHGFREGLSYETHPFLRFLHYIVVEY